jgi:hypothetical protein
MKNGTTGSEFTSKMGLEWKIGKIKGAGCEFHKIKRILDLFFK